MCAWCASRGGPPASTPPWLRVVAPAATPRRRARGTRVAEPEATYAVRERADDLWPWSPYHPAASPRAEEYLRAGAAALRHPEPPPTQQAHQREALAAFGRRAREYAPLATLESVALERWLQVRFGDPDGFADALLLERVAVVSAEDAALMRLLRAARVPEGDPAVADLAVDRAVLLEQTSPWRYLEGAQQASTHAGRSAALAALRAWAHRYRRAYAARYRDALLERRALLEEVAKATARDALERLNGIAALGAPEGSDALERIAATVAVLAAMPDAPQTDVAVTAGIVLGEPNPLAGDLRGAVEDARHALDARLRRLSARLAGCAIDRAGDDDLRAALTAIAASEVDHLDRVLDARLAAHIDRLLTEDAPRSPLARVAARYPAVTMETLEAAVEEFRAATADAIAASADGRAVLAE
ncbi:MAG: hypothetical protein EXR64_03780 [Dehalococcoidia bacterium]|nr:hypothetical protein [Dehalococcoidia bacterium]